MSYKKVIFRRKRRRKRTRSKIFGTGERPRLSVFRSLKHMYAQIINDTEGKTIVHASTLDKEIKEVDTYKGNAESAKKVGELLAIRAKEKNIAKVVFDKGSYKYHGRLKSLADAAREGGLEF